MASQTIVLVAYPPEYARLRGKDPNNMARAVAVLHDAVAVTLDGFDPKSYSIRSESEGVLASVQDPAAAAKAALSLLGRPVIGIGPRSVALAECVVLYADEDETGGAAESGRVVSCTESLRPPGEEGTILVSSAAVELVRPILPSNTSLAPLNLGRRLGRCSPSPSWWVMSVAVKPANDVVQSGAVSTNLPEDVSTFIGRKAELAEADRLLHGTRLLTLTGVGGTGKTRLALRLAASLLPRFRHGVFLAELDLVRDSTSVASAVLTAVGAKEQPDMTAAAALTQYLREREVLIVLDSCEHVVDAVARLTATILRYCPNVRVLATSREPLATTGEVTFAVLPLDVPATVEVPDVARMPQYDSVRLFIDRAMAADPTFKLDEVNAAAVAEVVGRLDGLPLAIELAAARVRGLTPGQIARHLSDRFGLLGARSRAALPRQRTLRALVDWSHDLLSESERTVWRRLTLFPAGCTLEGAEAVAGFDDVSALDVLDLIGKLVDKSVIHRTTTAGVPRYLMLETLRAYGRERLKEASEEDEAEVRFIAFEASLAARAVDRETALWGTEAAYGAYMPFLPELPNLRSAAERALARRDVAAAARIGAFFGRSALHTTLRMGDASEILRPIAAAVESAGARDRWATLAMHTCAFVDVEVGAEERRRRLEVAAEMACGADPGLRSTVFANLASGLLGMGDPVAARCAAEQAIELGGRAFPNPYAYTALADAELALRGPRRALAILDACEREHGAALQRLGVATWPLIGARARALLVADDLSGAIQVLRMPGARSESMQWRSNHQATLAIAYAGQRRGQEAFQLLLAQDDESLLLNEGEWAAVAVMAAAELLPHQAAAALGVRQSERRRGFQSVVPPAYDRAAVRLSETLGVDDLAAAVAEGERLRGLDRAGTLRATASAVVAQLAGQASTTPPQIPLGGSPSPQTRPSTTTTRSQWESDDVFAAVASMRPLNLADLTVVGAYVRCDPPVRKALRAWHERLRAPLQRDTKSYQNFLVQAASGSGASFFVQETARVLGQAVRFYEFNVARLPREELRECLADVSSCTGPILCLLDDIDVPTDECLSYAEMLPLLDMNLLPGRRAVFVLLGRHASPLPELAAHIARGSKGQAVLDRVPAGHRFHIPATTLEDRAVIMARHVADSAELRGTPIDEIEALALYYALVEPSLAGPRQLRDLAIAALHNLPRQARRLTYDDLFYRGDRRSRVFLSEHGRAAAELSGRYVRVRAPGQRRLSVGEDVRRATEPLTPREMDMLSLLARGLSDKDIAVTLNLSAGTVRVYLSRVYAKLGVQTRTQAVIEAGQRGWIDR